MKKESLLLGILPLYGQNSCENALAEVTSAICDCDGPCYECDTCY